MRRIPALYTGGSSQVFASMPGHVVHHGDVVWVFPNDLERRDLEPATDAGEPPDDLDELEELLDGFGKRPWTGSLWSKPNEGLILPLYCGQCRKRAWDEFIIGPRGPRWYGRLVSRTPIRGHVRAMNSLYGENRLTDSRPSVGKRSVENVRYHSDYPDRLITHWEYQCLCGSSRVITNTKLVPAYLKALRLGREVLYAFEDV